jgi:hypothetical protein
MFDDVAEVGAFMQAFHEAAGLAGGAMVIVQARQQCQQPVDEARHGAALDTIQVAQLQFHREHWAMAEDIWTRKSLDAVDFHMSLEGGQHGGFLWFADLAYLDCKSRSANLGRN